MSDEQLSKDHEWDRSKYPAATTSYFGELTNKIKLVAQRLSYMSRC